MSKEKELTLALLRNDQEKVKILIENGASLTVKDPEGLVPIESAFNFGSLEMVEFLIKNYANSLSAKLLHIACMASRKNVLELLVNKVFDVKAKLENGNTLLHSCFEERGATTELIDYLIEKGLSIDEVNNNNETPLHLACKNSKLPIIKFLIEDKKANIESVTKNGNSIQFYACRNDDIEVLKLLNQKGLELDVKNLNGDTLIYSAACNWFGLDFIKMIIETKIDPNHINNDNQTALTYVQSLGSSISLNPNVIELLGGDISDN
jgi:ankyrin repeat protein